MDDKQFTKWEKFTFYLTTEIITNINNGKHSHFGEKNETKNYFKKNNVTLVPITLLTLLPNITNGQTTFPSGSTITTEGEVYAPGELSQIEIEAQNIIDSGEDSGVVELMFL